MADNIEDQADDQTVHTPQEDDGATATLVKPKPARPRVDRLPPWRVLLHNDEKNDMVEVVESIVRITTLTRVDAFQRMLEAHSKGLSLLLTTHREHAELLQEQFMSRKLTVTIEPGD